MVVRCAILCKVQVPYIQTVSSHQGQPKTLHFLQAIEGGNKRDASCY